nr:hypothetical protein [Saccharofermentans sp.]
MSPEIETKVLEKLDKMEKHSAEFEEMVLAKFDRMEKHSTEFEEKVLAKFDEIDNRFDEIDKKFEGKFKELDKKIENNTDMIMNYLFEMSQTMKGMDKRLKTVESTVKRAGTIMVHSATCGSPQD